MRKEIILAGASVLALSVACAASAQNLVANGSFEGANGLSGWTIGGTASDGYLPVAIQYNQASQYPTGAQGEAVPTDNAPSASPDGAGSQGVYFVSDHADNLSVYQNIYLSPGTYQIGFDTYDTYNGANEPNDANLTADIAGVQLANYALSSVAPGVWTTHSGLATITVGGYYPVAFIFNTTVFPAKDVVIDQAYVIGASGAGTPVAPPERLYWDGDTSGNANNNRVDGGVGTWTAVSPNFTDQTGATNGAYYPQPGSVIFTGAPGVVTVDNSAGAVAVTGMQFAIDGYQIVGGAITLSGASAIVQVGDGTAASSGYTASIAAPLIGSAGLTKTDLGTLILSGQNSFTGPTNVNAGVLKGGAANAFSAASAMTIDASAVLDLGGFNQTVSSLAGGGTLTNSGTAGAVLTNQGASSTFSGVIQDGASPTGLTENAAGATLTLSGANSYSGATTITAGTLLAGAANTFSAASATTVGAAGVLDLGGFNQTVSSLAGGGAVTNSGSAGVVLTNQGASSTFSGVIQDGASPTGLTENAAGATLTLSGANTYSGATTITAGTLLAGAANAFSAASATTVGASGVLDLGGFNQTVSSLAGGGAVTNSGTAGAALTNQGASSTFSGVIKDGASPTGLTENAAGATLTLSGANTYTGATTITAGTLMAGAANTFSAASAMTVGASGVLDLGGFNQTVSSLASGGVVTNSGSAGVVLTNQGASSTFSGVIQDGASPTGLTENAVGATLTLSGANTYSGATTITAGTLLGGAANAFSAASAMTVGTSGVLDLGGFNQSVSTLAGGGAVTSSVSGGGGAQASGPAILSIYGSGATTFSGQITDGASAVGLSLQGSSQTLTLSGTNNSFSGGVNVGAGDTVSIDNANAIGTGLITLQPNATLAFTGSGYTLADNVYLAIPDQGPTVDSGTGVITMTGVISGPGKLDKQGSGTLILDNAETYTGGTEVHAGTLQIGDASTPTAQLAAGAVQVDSGATLEGYGTIQGSVTNDGVLYNNNAFAATGLTIEGSFTQHADGNLIIGVTPNWASLLTVGGTASLAGTVTFAYAPGTYHAATLKFLGAAGGVSGTFSTVATSTPVPTDLNQSVSYKSNEVDLVLTSTIPVAPADRRVFSAQASAFSSSNVAATADLLGRTRPDGGGDTLYNLIPTRGEPVRTWASADVSSEQANASAAGPGFHIDTSGFNGGGDVDIGRGDRIGVALGFDHDSLRDEAHGSASADIVRAGVYGSQPLGAIGLSEAVSYARAWNHIDRATGAGLGVSGSTADEWSAGIQASAPFQWNQVQVDPAAGILATRLTTGGFQETDAVSAAFAVSGRGQTLDVISPYVNLGFSRTFVTSDGVAVTPDALIGYRRDGAARGESFTLIAADSTAFEGNRTQLSPDVGLFGLSLTAHRGQWSAYAKYRAQVSRDWTDHSGSLGIRLAF